MYDSPSFPRLTPAVKHLLLANAAVFVLNMPLLGVLSVGTEDGGGFWFAFSWAGMLEGWGLGVLRLITYQFTHSFYDIFHFLMNMLVLYFFGTLAEMRLGYRGMWKLYLLGGVVGALVHLLFAAILGYANVPLVGASGACYAILIYAAFMAPHQEVIFIFVRVKLWFVAALLVTIGLYSMFIEFVAFADGAGGGGGVSHGAHLGGAALGWLVFHQNWFRDFVPYESQPGPIARLRASWRARQQATRERQSRHKEQLLDEILAKVKEHGLGSLTPQERKFLEKTSEETRRGP